MSARRAARMEVGHGGAVPGKPLPAAEKTAKGKCGHA